MAYQNLGEKRTAKATGKEKSGKHGTAVDGIAAPVTPHNTKTSIKPSIPGKLDQMPSYGEDPFTLNPQLKGFLQADTWRGSSHFPVNPLRMKRGNADAETRDGSGFSYKEVKGKNAGPASVKTSRG